MMGVPFLGPTFSKPIQIQENLESIIRGYIERAAEKMRQQNQAAKRCQVSLFDQQDPRHTRLMGSVDFLNKTQGAGSLRFCSTELHLKALHPVKGCLPHMSMIGIS
jgi:hypothetical protein